MPSKTYFVLMRGSKSSLLPIVLGTQQSGQRKPSYILMPYALHMWRCRYPARLPDTLGRDGRLGDRRTLGTFSQKWTGTLRLGRISAPFLLQ